MSDRGICNDKPHLSNREREGGGDIKYANPFIVLAKDSSYIFKHFSTMEWQEYFIQGICNIDPMYRKNKKRNRKFYIITVIKKTCIVTFQNYCTKKRKKEKKRNLRMLLRINQVRS